MSKYEYYEQEGVQAVTRDGGGIEISVGNTQPVELTKQQFKEIKDAPSDFSDKFEIVQTDDGQIAQGVKDVDKNE